MDRLHTVLDCHSIVELNYIALTAVFAVVVDDIVAVGMIVVLVVDMQNDLEDMHWNMIVDDVVDMVCCMEVVEIVVVVVVVLLCSVYLVVV